MASQATVPTRSVLRTALPSSTRELIENMLAKPLMGLSLLNLGASELVLKSQPPSMSGAAMAARVIRKASGIMEMATSSMWALSMSNSSAGSKAAARSKVRVATRMRSRLVTTGPLKSQTQLPPTSSIKVVANSRERGTSPCSRARSMRLPVAGSVRSISLSSAIRRIPLLSRFPPSAGAGRICRTIRLGLLASGRPDHQGNRGEKVPHFGLGKTARVCV